MALAKITIIGMEQWANNYNKSLFSDIDIPNAIDKSLLIDTVLLEAGEFEPLYADFDFYKFAIGNFFKKYKSNFEKMIIALDSEYNPLHNYDRHEEWTDNSNTVDNQNYSNNGSANNKASNNSNLNNTDNVTTENKVSAYDSSTYQPKEHNTSNNNTQSTIIESNTSDSISSSSGASNSDSKVDSTHKGHLYGNIGVTTNQQMIESEMDMRDKYNIYDIITNTFIRHLTVAVYD